MDLCGCGIPYIILEGTAEDYKKIISKAKQLSKYVFDWYINRIIPHIEKMVAAKEGKIDVDYFKNMIQKREEKKVYQDWVQKMLNMIILVDGSWISLHILVQEKNLYMRQ